MTSSGQVYKKLIRMAMATGLQLSSDLRQKWVGRSSLGSQIMVQGPWMGGGALQAVVNKPPRTPSFTTFY